MKTERALYLLMSIALAACADTSTKVETETHFLQSCQSSCEDGLDCICGVCTEACSGNDACEALAGAASCAAIPSACGHLGQLCDVTCTVLDDCEAFGASFDCVSGRCRSETGGNSGAGGSGGSDDAGASGSGGQSGGVGGGSGAGGALDGGGGSDGGDANVTDTACDTAGDACCDPFPGDGPNYCNDLRLMCGANNTCEVNCDCGLLGANFPVCGVDGMGYDTTCGNECVPVEIACRGTCPCDPGYCTVQCTGAAPDQEVTDACAAITEMSACTSYETGGFPSGCRWVTPSTEPCPLVPGMP